LQYALDGNGDNLIDLRNQAQDAMASIANFLIMHGWQVGQPATLQITQGAQSLDITKQLADGDPNPKLSLDMLKKAGIVSDWPTILNDQSPALIVDLPGTDKAGNDHVEYIVGLKNFEVITQYNRSFFYATAVLDFAKTISAVISPTNLARAQPQPIKPKKPKK
jgi:membrane-bound lytic murein transglycosylase B